MATILIDANVPMYLVGGEHPNKVDAKRLLERCVADGARLVTDAEVLQEILHRYVAVNRKDMVQLAFDALLAVTDEVFPIGEVQVVRAKEVVFGSPGLSARDGIHVAVMESQGIGMILSFDHAFDDVPGIRRLT